MKNIFHIVLVMFIFACVRVNAQNKAAYLIPDIGAPGMNVYIELLAHTDSLWAFGTETFVESDSFYLDVANTADNGKLQFSPLFISWSGRLITAQVFIHPNLRPESWKWNEGIHIPISLFQNGIAINTFDFYVVKPCPLGDIRSNTQSVLGQGTLGIRSPRGAMLVDSLILDAKTYTVSVNDPDNNPDNGNQAYLPFILTAIGDIKGEGTTISVDATNQDGGPGGGGGGGSFYDDKSIFGGNSISTNHINLQGGKGFTGGGIGGINQAILGGGDYSNGGLGSGSKDMNNKTMGNMNSWSGYSLNGVKGAQKGAYESSGGGTGHPFGTSGRGSVDGDNDEGNGGYGAGSGGKQNTSGGCGVYTNISSTIPNTIKNGSIIGNQFVVPIAGGSGGASANPNPLLLERGFGGYGGGGGGAIVINARNVTLHKITANGSIGQNNSYGAANVRGGNGSAGAVVVSARVKLLVDSVLCFPYGSSMDGVSRYDVWDIFYNPISHVGKTSTGVALDTTTKINPDIVTTIGGRCSGNDTSALYIKGENETQWRLLADTLQQKWEYTFQPSFWQGSSDTIYYLITVGKISSSRNDELYTAVPDNLLGQAGANILQLMAEQEPHIELVENYTIDTIETCADKDVTIDVQRIWNSGEAELILSNVENTLWWSFGMTNNKNIQPGDSLTLQFSYTVPASIQSGIYYDTISIYHNDPNTTNPWVISVQIPVSRYVLGTSPTTMNLGIIYLTASTQDTTIEVINPNPQAISFTNIICNSSKFNYTFNPTSGNVPSGGRLNVVVNYTPISTVTDGESNDTIKITTECGNVAECIISAYLTTSAIATKDTSIIPIGRLTECDTVNFLNNFANGTPDIITMYDVVLHGDDASLFKYVGPDSVLLEPNGTLWFTMIVDPRGQSKGTKTAYLDFYCKDKSGLLSIRPYKFTFEIIDAFSPTPILLDFGNTVSENAGSGTIRLDYESTFYGVITEAYLQNGDYFALDNNIVGTQLKDTSTIVNVIVSYDAIQVGDWWDTLVVIVPYDFCNDTTKIPIHLKVLAKEIVNEEYIKDTIAKCNSKILSAYFYNNVGDTLYSVTTNYTTFIDEPIIEITHSNIPPCELVLGDYSNIWLRTDKNTSTGVHNVDVEHIIKHKNGDTERSILHFEIYVIDGMVKNTDVLDFGTVYMPNTDTMYAIIQNMTNDTLEIVEAWLIDGENFNIDTNFNFIAFDNEVLHSVISVKNTSTDAGIVYDTLLVVVQYQQCLDTLLIPITANIVPVNATDVILLAPKINNADPTTKNYKLPFYITSAEDVQSFTIDSIVFSHYVGNFYPKYVDNGNGTIVSEIFGVNKLISITNVQVPAIKAGDTIVAFYIIGDMLLGDYDSTEIIVRTGMTEQDNILIRTENGYIVTEICEEGIDRLLNIETGAVIGNIVNPVKDVLEVECSPIETGNCVLEIVDLSGHIVLSKEFVANKDISKYKHSITVSNISSGTYFLVLHTANQKFSVKFIIAR